MTYYVVTKQPGELSVIEEVQTRKLGLEFLQKKVGGYIELVSLAPEIDMYIDEEGKLKELEPNLRYPMDIIVGPVIVCTSTAKGESVGFKDKGKAEQVKQSLDRASFSYGIMRGGEIDGK